MPDQVWYRSLYFRIAAGFVALLAVLLVVQVFVFLWMTGRMTEFFPSRSPAQFAATMASDLSGALADKPDTPIEAYLNEHYTGAYRAFAVATLDGRVVIGQRIPPPPNIGMSALRRLFSEPGVVSPFPDRRGPGPGDAGDPNRFDGFGRGGGRGFRPDAGGTPRPPDSSPRPDSFGRGGFGRGDGRDGRGGGGGGRGGQTAFEYAPVTVNGATVAMVAVPIEPPPLSVALRSLGPILAIVALSLLVAGTAIGALVVVRPVHARLKSLQDAARSLGSGDTGARAPETGRDEVTSLARTFNEMAGQLEERTQALETADRTRRQLLADVSHELTTPLAAIRGYVETLGMTHLQLDEARRARYLHIVTEEAERLEHIVGDLLDLARLEGGGGSLRMEDVSLSHLLARVRDRHAPVVRQRGITLETVKGDETDTLVGDTNRLEQALQNLVANAVRHTPDGGHVTVRTDHVGDQVRLAVEDTGPGIPPEHLSRIFDRFYKVDESRTGTAVPSGSGLGLSIVQAIVSRHGGTVRASNLPQGGARFEILLPLPSVAPASAAVD